MAHDSVSSYKKIGIICPYEKFGKSRYRSSAYPSTLMRNRFMRRTTQQTFSAINFARQQKTTKLFFSSQVRKELNILAVPFKSLRCCL